MTYTPFLSRMREIFFGKYGRKMDLGRSLSEVTPASDSGPMSDHDLALAIREVRDAPLWKDTRKTDRLPGNQSQSHAEGHMGKPCGIEIVRHAYALWEQAGKPDGKDQEFYLQAERELTDASADPQAVSEEAPAAHQ
jgi:hypothetical protein